jgi:hypothetical protein
MTTDALSRLRPGELCVIVVHNGAQQEAAWRPELRAFITGQDVISADTISEWWPASIRF